MTLDITQTLADLRREVQTLKDIEAVRNVKHAYFRCVDTGNLEEAKELFHPEVKVHFKGGTYEWVLNNREEYLAAIGKSFNAKVAAQHNGHHPEIQILSETEATGTWYLHDIFWNMNEQKRTVGTALYRDKYLKTDGRWQIVESVYERIYEIVDQPIADPNLTAHMLARTGRPMP